MAVRCSIPGTRSALALHPLALAATFVVAGCTFYTGQPNANPGQTSTTKGGAGGTASVVNGGTSSSGASGGSLDDAGDVDSGVIPWADATGALVGRTTSPGAVLYLSAKPDEDMLIAGLAGFGLWASTDAGQTWNGLGQSGTSDLITNGVNALVYDPDHQKTFWEAGIYGPGVYRTDDDGVTITEQGTVAHVDLVAIDFTDPKRKTMLAGPHEKTQTAYLSSDGGTTWDTIGANLPMDAGFSSFPVVIDAQTFLLGCSNMIMRSADGGMTWDKVSSTGGYRAPLLASDGSIYWGTQGDLALMRSTDQGLTWTRVVAANVIHTATLLELPDKRLASINGQYVIVSADAGVTWKVATSPFPFQPAGLTYSMQQKAFFIWASTSAQVIPSGFILRYDWDYQTQ